MREVRRTVEVPASERVEVSYACEEAGCGFATVDEREARAHWGREHAARGEQPIGDVVFLRFDSESDFSAFSEAVVGGGADHEVDYVDGRWVGPGWYGKQYRSSPRGCGCCSERTLKLVPAALVREEWRSRAERLGRLADLLDDLADSSRGGSGGAVG